MDNYFIYEGIKYIIKYNDNKRIIFKEINGNIIELTKEEQSKIDEIFTIDNGYVYYSNRLENLIINNNDIEDKNYVLNFLTWIENIIPKEYRDNFYYNIETLKINFDSTEMNPELEKRAEGSYHTTKNVIDISKKNTLRLKEKSKKYSDPNDYFKKKTSLTLLHELLHMASTKYDATTKISLCGFDKYPTEDLKEQNRGLTEGMTECLAMIGVPGTIECESGYYIEVCFISQLVHIVGGDILLKSFFGNFGIKEIEKELQKIDESVLKSYFLFRNIENSFMLRKREIEINSFVGNIQSTLIDYFEKKINMLESEGNYDEIDKCFQLYEKALITPQILKNMKKNPEDYDGILESVNKFNELKNKYIKEKCASILK